MSESLPEPYPTELAGQRPDDAARAQAEQIIDAVNDVMTNAPTHHRDDTPLPLIGPTPPVTQPGRAPMSQAATDASGLMLAAGVGSLGAGGGVALVLVASGYADPVVIACMGAAPAVVLVALRGLVKAVKQAAPDEHHHHYSGPVTQDHSKVTNHNRFWGRSTDNR